MTISDVKYTICRINSLNAAELVQAIEDIENQIACNLEQLFVNQIKLAELEFTIREYDKELNKLLTI